MVSISEHPYVSNGKVYNYCCNGNVLFLSACASSLVAVGLQVLARKSADVPARVHREPHSTDHPVSNVTVISAWVPVTGISTDHGAWFFALSEDLVRLTTL